MKKIKKIKIDRLFHGYASLRDYQVKDAIKNGQDIEVFCKENGEQILIKWHDLGKRWENGDRIFSKHIRGQHYDLWNYDWQTFRKKTPQTVQFDLFTSLKTIANGSL